MAPRPHSPRLAALALAAACFGAACAGSTFNVTSGREAVGRQAPPPTRSCEVPTWTSHESEHGLYSLRHPASWQTSPEKNGHFMAQHPDGTMVFETRAAWLPHATDEVPKIRAQRFAEAETLSPWTRRDRKGGYMLEGILRQGDEVVIARYLVANDRYLEATLRTSEAFDDACRKLAVDLMGSLVLRDSPRPGSPKAIRQAPPAQADPEPESEAAPEPAPEPEPETPTGDDSTPREDAAQTREAPAGEALPLHTRPDPAPAGDETAPKQ